MKLPNNTRISINEINVLGMCLAIWYNIFYTTVKNLQLVRAEYISLLWF